MPPKRIITKTSNSKPSKPPTLIQSSNEEIDVEAELKFDQEVLWCITQFEKLIKSGKINDAKKNESIRAIATLRRTNVPKIQKIQLMKQYFKDYKTKMQKDEEFSQEIVQFESKSHLNGKFVKKKSEGTSAAISNSSVFLFNFPSNETDEKLSNQVIEKLKI